MYFLCTSIMCFSSRFPLRNEASSLSDTIYNPQKAKTLYNCFIRDAHHMLTFLKVNNYVFVKMKRDQYSTTLL